MIRGGVLTPTRVRHPTTREQHSRKPARYQIGQSAALNRQTGQLNQPQPLEARMPVLTDDDVIVHGDAERPRDVDDRLRHLDVRLRRRRIAGG